MKRLAVALSLCAVLAQFPARAEAPTDPLAWLGRIANASQRLNYSGTFIYQTGRNIETSRIVHMVDGSGEYERLEALDGKPREVIRNSTELRCILPEQKIVIIDQPGSRSAFPARIPASFATLAEHYRIRKGEVGRVAGLTAQVIELEPKDGLRYGHLFWADTQSGLLLKAKMVNDHGDVIEQFTFSDVKIGGNLDRDAVKSRFVRGGDWKVVNARGSELRREDIGWELRTPLPGFSLMSAMRRPLGPERGEAVHLVYSDGLAAISVFIEPQGSHGKAAELGMLTSGAINIYKRIVDGHLITTLGEVPQRALQQVGDGIEPATIQ